MNQFMAMGDPTHGRVVYRVGNYLRLECGVRDCCTEVGHLQEAPDGWDAGLRPGFRRNEAGLWELSRRAQYQWQLAEKKDRSWQWHRSRNRCPLRLPKRPWLASTTSDMAAADLPAPPFRFRCPRCRCINLVEASDLPSAEEGAQIWAQWSGGSR
jgi:hypothetical protein